jgi:TetR/AcrR family transcriptional repressor of nem operon
MGKGSETRERILEIAEASVLAKGLNATSIDEIIAEAGITKSGFFYHFADKNVLARELVRRYGEANDRVFAEVFGRGDELGDGDPLASFLIGIKLLAEVAGDLEGGHPGCLIASMIYQERGYDREVREMIEAAVKNWNAFFLKRIEAILERYQPSEPVDAEALARLLSCVFDGGIIMSKALHDPSVLPQQILALRAYYKMLFAPAVPVRAAA